MQSNAIIVSGEKGKQTEQVQTDLSNQCRTRKLTPRTSRCQDGGKTPTSKTL